MYIPIRHVCEDLGGDITPPRDLTRDEQIQEFTGHNECSIMFQRGFYQIYGVEVGQHFFWTFFTRIRYYGRLFCALTRGIKYYHQILDSKIISLLNTTLILQKYHYLQMAIIYLLTFIHIPLPKKIHNHHFLR